MANFIGVKCPVCEEIFTSTDDIVVCPVCGAPHHRSCYHTHGECAFQNLHSTGHVWQHPEGAAQRLGQNGERHEPGTQNAQTPNGQREPVGSSGHIREKACPSCGAANPDAGIFCKSCGARIAAGGESTSGYWTTAASGAYNAAFGGVSPNEEIDGVSARDLALYVGPSSYYFLPRFKAISSGYSFSPNFSALFFSFFYFFYRKMYLIGGVLLGIQLILQIPTLAMLPDLTAFYAEHMQDIFMGIDVSALFEPKTNLWAFRVLPHLRYIPPIVSLLFSIFANRLYLSLAVRKIKKTKLSCQQNNKGFDERIYTELLSQKGRTSFFAPVLVCVGMFMLYFVVASIFSPQFNSMVQSLMNTPPT